jgi:hypothetical protein
MPIPIGISLPSHDYLDEEARYLHAALFSTAADDTILERYRDAHRQLFPDEPTSPLVARVVGKRLDAEAIEYALRRRKAGRELTRKLQIISYLAETRREYHDEFVNIERRPIFAFVLLGAALARSTWKLLKGVMLVRRHGLL